MPIFDLSKEHHRQIRKLVSEIYNMLSNKAEFNWPDSMLEDELTKVSGLVFIENDELQSFVCYRDVGDCFEISILATGLSYQKKGYQTKIIKYLQQVAALQNKSIVLEVHEQNQAAMQFYLSLSFNQINRRKSYYKDQSDAIVMLWGANKVGC